MSQNKFKNPKNAPYVTTWKLVQKLP